MVCWNHQTLVLTTEYFFIKRPWVEYKLDRDSKIDILIAIRRLMCQYWMQLSRIHVLRKCCHKQISFLFVKRCQIVSFYTRSRRKLRYVYRCHFVCIQTCKIGKMYSALRHLQVFTHLALIIDEIKVCGLGFLQHMVLFHGT